MFIYITNNKLLFRFIHFFISQYFRVKRVSRIIESFQPDMQRHLFPLSSLLSFFRHELQTVESNSLILYLVKRIKYLKK